MDVPVAVNSDGRDGVNINRRDAMLGCDLLRKLFVGAAVSGVAVFLLLAPAQSWATGAASTAAAAPTAPQQDLQTQDQETQLDEQRQAQLQQNLQVQQRAQQDQQRTVKLMQQSALQAQTAAGTAGAYMPSDISVTPWGQQ
jgi:uncharacterized membrane protein